MKQEAQQADESLYHWKNYGHCAFLFGECFCCCSHLTAENAIFKQESSGLDNNFQTNEVDSNCLFNFLSRMHKPVKTTR
jgi:hypothetical protein